MSVALSCLKLGQPKLFVDSTKFFMIEEKVGVCKQNHFEIY